MGTAAWRRTLTGIVLAMPVAALAPAAVTLSDAPGA